MGANGGFTFLIIYLILAACCGFIVMMGELALGRKTGRGAIGAYKILSRRFKWLGWLGVLSAFLILGFYCALGGYCLKYVTLNVGNLFHAGFGTGTLDGAGVFGALMANQGECRDLRSDLRGHHHDHRDGRRRRRHRKGLLRGYARSVRDAGDLHHPFLHPGGRVRGSEVYVCPPAGLWPTASSRKRLTSSL